MYTNFEEKPVIFILDGNFVNRGLPEDSLFKLVAQYSII